MKKIFLSLIESFIRNIDGGIGLKIRYLYYKNRLGKCGKGVRIETGVFFYNPNKIYLGSNIIIDKNCIFVAGCNEKRDRTKAIEIKQKVEKGKLTIGSNSHIGINSILQAHGGIFIDEYFTCSSGCKFFSLSNDVHKCRKGIVDIGDNFPYYIEKAIYIEQNVWFGINVTIVGGVVGNNSFIKPNSVITNEIKANSINEGFPAKFIKTRFN